MTNLLPLASFTFEAAPTPAKTLGRKGGLQWIPVSKLRIDDSYQRPIDKAGKNNIRRIIENFAWHKFAPIVVSPRNGGVYAVVDGQHRAVACALHGDILDVPCLVLSCTPEEEAGAFATINGIVTRMHPQYLFRARIASGDKGATAADEAAKAAGARIMPYPVAASQLKVGETLSGRTIEVELVRVGRAVVVAALELVTRTGSGNAGMLKASIIEGFCDVYSENPKWLKAEEEVRRIVHRVSVKEILARAIRRQADNPGSLRNHIAVVLADVIRETLGDGGATAQPIVTGKMLAREARKAAPPPMAKPAPKPKAVKAPAKPLPIIVRDDRIKLRPQQRIVTAATVSDPERAAIEAHLKAKGVRKFSTADSGDDWALCEWLTRKGFEVTRITGKGKGHAQFKIAGKPHTRESFIAFVNKQRKKHNLPPIGARAA
jgi:hypothetical protein